ncbi:transporter substrate-binding domain-containing protein [Wielerella bovis]|uniref:transporter substrate-binding domain-containing protein n=1 Tax=Wielerella bovis TaxID=2917790 RepID=UPI0020194E4F|nr:transporter substrate-binding domain-containing protein [Wielerella bovis]ULJ70090.1 transporter substrate-binding domain-containing protein [Wielerella bovis]
MQPEKLENCVKPRGQRVAHPTLAAAQEQNKSAATTETVAGSATATVQESNNGGETYIVMSQPSYPPFATRGDKGEMIGLDMDLLNAIAKKASVGWATRCPRK